MAKLEVFVKDIESHLITTKTSFPEMKGDIFGKPSDPRTKDLNQAKDNQGGSGSNRYNKMNSPGHSANSLKGNHFPIEEKVPWKKKWNSGPVDQMDDFVYWDTIGGRVDDQARVSTDRRPEVTVMIICLLNVIQYSHRVLNN